MHVSVIGAGPAGLYAAILIRRARPDTAISVFEQNPADATWGFGVVFSDQALAFLRKDDPETADLIEPHMKRWSDIALVHKDAKIVIDGVGFAGIGRLRLLKLLQKRAGDLGIAIEFGTRIEAPVRRDSELIIGADGLNSVVRASGDFGETINSLTNRFAWYGADREFDALTQTFITTEYGAMNAHHYSYAPGRSTFIIEMPADVFARTGFDRMSEPDYRRTCERLFQDSLQGAPLIANNSVWRRFPDLSCARWFDGNRVLVGDALHTAHFSIGSGTRLALEDAVALVKALQDSDWQVPAALLAYQAARKPILDKLVGAARSSSDWYENFAAHMALDPWPFALSYIQRGGRVDAARLREIAPRFTLELEKRGIDLECVA
jgi:2-polyprenyl-6-methoxyphenol hydroxylase-like FAD-dependent oxidoreductase